MNKNMESNICKEANEQYINKDISEFLDNKLKDIKAQPKIEFKLRAADSTLWPRQRWNWGKIGNKIKISKLIYKTIMFKYCDRHKVSFPIKSMITIKEILI